MVNKYNPYSDNKFKLLITITFLIILIIGLYNSYKVSFGLIKINSDVVDTGLLWQGVLQHGWGFLKSWNYNFDNWLLSLFPIHFILFQIFGINTNIILWFGYFVFLANIIVCGLIAYELESYLAIPAIIVLLLFGNYFLYYDGLITFPITHNSSNLYGLICLLLIIKWTKKPSFLYLFFSIFFFLITGLSDPWFLPSYGLPILLTQIGLLTRYLRSPPVLFQGAYFIAALVCCFLGIYTKLFGLLNFTTQKHIVLFGFGDIFLHLKNYVQNLGSIFYLLPIFEKLIIQAFSLIVIYLMTLIVFLKYMNDKSKNLAELNYLLTCIFSIVFISISFILLPIPKNHLQDGATARYLINIPFFIITTICMGLEKYWNIIHVRVKIFIFATGLLYLLTSLYSSTPLWIKKINTDKDNYYKLYNFLLKNKLYYGYADYWKSNIVTWISYNKVQVRPLMFYDQTGEVISNFHLQSSKKWYEHSDLPKDPTTFIIVQKEYSQCSDKISCVNKLSQQFGPPNKVLEYSDYFVMVWDHPLLNIIKNLPKKY